MAAYEFGVYFMLAMTFGIGGLFALLLWRVSRRRTPPRGGTGTGAGSGSQSLSCGESGR